MSKKELKIIKFDLKSPPIIEVSSLFSIDTLVRMHSREQYDVIHRLPFKNNPKGAIFVLSDEGSQSDSSWRIYSEFEKKVSEVWKGIIVGRLSPQSLNVIIPEKELHILDILDTIRKYTAIENVSRVIYRYRYKQ